MSTRENAKHKGTRKNNDMLTYVGMSNSAHDIKKFCLHCSFDMAYLLFKKYLHLEVLYNSLSHLIAA